MTSVEPTEIEELCARVLGIIGAYGMGDSNPRELYLKNTARLARPPKTVPVPDGGNIRDGSSEHLVKTARIAAGD